jgi:hypothetical protein
MNNTIDHYEGDDSDDNYLTTEVDSHILVSKTDSISIENSPEQQKSEENHESPTENKRSELIEQMGTLFPEQTHSQIEISRWDASHQMMIGSINYIIGKRCIGKHYLFHFLYSLIHQNIEELFVFTDFPERFK